MNEPNSSKVSICLSLPDGESDATQGVTSVQLVADGEKALSIQETDALWRYISLAKLINLLSNRILWLSRVDLLDDPFEGSTLWPHLEKRASFPEHKPEDISAVHQTMRRWVLVSCWHLSPHESHAMWRLYGLNTEGIALKTSVGQLKKELETSVIKNSENQLQNLPTNFFIGPVFYVDYRRTEIIDPSNPFARYFLKREAFTWEREYRVIAAAPRLLMKEGVSDTEMPSFQGIGIPIDPRSLIEEIVVSPLAPSWFCDVVNKTVCAFNSSLSVRKSSLNENAQF